MARGWESKSVEEQQAAATTTSSELKQRLTPEQAARKQKAESLQLSRKRILQQLEVASHPAYRRSLEQALASLDDQLARLV